MSDVMTRKLRLDDGSAFSVTDVVGPGVNKQLVALVATEAIKAAAASLLGVSEAQLRARAKHLAFLQEEDSDSLRLSQARVAAQESASRYYILEMLSRGENVDRRKVVTLADWVGILEHFSLPTATGSLQDIGG